MDNKDKYINEIRSLLLKSSDEKTKEKVLRLISDAKCIGVAVPEIRRIAKSYKADYKPDFNMVCNITDSFFANEYFIYGFPVIVLQKGYLIYMISWDKIENWLNHSDNWETCDQFSIIVTLVIVKNPILLKELYRLTVSEKQVEKAVCGSDYSQYESRWAPIPRRNICHLQKSVSR